MEQKRHLGGYIRAISNALSQEMQAGEQGVTCTQGMFLHHLWYRKTVLGQETYARDLEDFFDIRHSTVSGVLQRMEVAGLVTMEADEEDRRRKAIRLTDKAVEHHTQTGLRIQRTEEQIVRGMTEDEVAQFRRLLQMAANNLGVCHCKPEKEQEERL